MKKLLFIALMVSSTGIYAQDSEISNAFKKEINSYLEGTIPIITVEELSNKEESDILLLDTRDHKEYLVSTIPNAIYVGYDDFDISSVSHIPRETEIVVFCSIGYRSEKIGNKLKIAGYKNVKTLYGSIFAWVNHAYPLVTPSGQPTKRLHTYNKKWSKWVDNPKVEKVW